MGARSFFPCWGASTMRILLTLLFVGFVLYVAQAIFAGEETTPSSAKTAGEAGAETGAASDAKAPAAQALTAEELAPSPANSKHAITVEQAALPAKNSAGSETAPPAQPRNAEVPPQAPSDPSFVKVMSPASIREGPSTSAAIVGVAQPGAEAQVVAHKSDWIEIIDPGSKKTGWIHQSFLVPQANPSARAVPPQELDAALARPENDAEAAGDDVQPSITPKKRKHASRHRRRHHRHGIAFGWVYVPY
jgi:SH3-like domain-containing protein